MNTHSGRRVVLVTGTSIVPEEARDHIRERGFQLKVIADDDIDKERLHEELRGVAGYLIGGNEAVLAEHFDRASALEVVAWVGTDFKAYVPGWKRAFERGIAFVSTPGANAASVAEFTILLMLAIARPFTSQLVTNIEPESGGTQGTETPPAGVELQGLKLGIIGAGRIGARVAKIAQGLGMNVRYTAPRRNEALEAALGLTHLEPMDLIEGSDVISLHRPGPAPGEPRTLGWAELRQAKLGALVVNAAHPDLIDPEALLWAIEQHGLRAAFDGIGPEDAWKQLVSLGADRFVATRNIAPSTGAAARRAGLRAAQAVCDVLSGEDSDLVNNPDFRDRRGPQPSA